MSGKYATLTPDWVMRGWLNVPFALVNTATLDCLPLTEKAAYVARSCDGNTDFESILFMPDHLAVLDRLVEERIATSWARPKRISQRQQYRKAPNPHIRGIHWAVTNRCNLNCRHCYLGESSGGMPELSLDRIEGIVAQFDRANVTEVHVTGGEPFARADLLDILDLLTQKCIRVTQIYTNGTLITEAALQRLIAMGQLPAFLVSLDAMGGHDRMRGVRGAEARTVEAIRRIRSSGFKLYISTCVDRATIGFLPSTYRFLRSVGADFWTVCTPANIGRWRGSTSCLSLQEEGAAYMPLLRQWCEDGMPFSLKLGLFFDSAVDLNRTHLLAFEAPHKPSGYACSFCRKLPHLTPDGTLLPCALYTDTSLRERMPNLLAQDLSEILTKSQFTDIVDLTRADLLRRNTECIRCPALPRCRLGCRASALAESGDVLARDPVACDFWKNGHKEGVKRLLRQYTTRQKGAAHVEGLSQSVLAEARNR